MESSSEQFAHVMLFECPECRRPLASACASTKRSLEDADAHWFNPHCPCGWTGRVVGLTAVQHWVVPWEPPVPIGMGVPWVKATTTLPAAHKVSHNGR